MPRPRLNPGLIHAGFCLLGLAFFFQPELASGFRRMQWDFGDTRLHNFVLEHGYRWLRGADASLWNPPIFYPTPDATCFTDTMLGTLPFYAFWRLLSFAPDSAMQAWMISMTVLNFASMLWLLRGPLRFEPVPASAGAFLFAFGYPRAIQLGHPQLLQQFPLVLALAALWRFYQERTSRGRLRFAAIFLGATVLQLYSSFYLGWFLIFGTGVAGIFALAGKDRRALLAPLKAEAPKLLAACFVAALSLLPLALHYLSAAQIVGLRPFQATYQPRLLSWLYLGPESPLYAWQDAIKSFRVLGTFGPEQKLGMGLVTTTLLFMGWRGLGKQSGLRLVGLTAVALFLLVTEIIPGVRVWRLAYELVPGAKALRALPRVSFVLLVPAAVGLAGFFSSRRVPRLLSYGLLAVFVLEQAHIGESFDKAAQAADVASLEQRIGKNCQAFFYSPRGTRESLAPAFKYQIDAMWASLASGVPTVNGYSGGAPQDWDFWENRILDEKDRARLEQALKQRARAKNLDYASICWID